jgi:LSD1 subclass zinc finger protein
MATIKCPSCQRILNLPDSLRGTEVQCPTCQTTFVPPREEELLEAIPLADPVAQAVPEPPAPSPESGGPAEAFAFNDEEQATENRVRRKVNEAAAWLQRTVICDFIPTLMCCPCAWAFKTASPVPNPEILLIALGAAGLILLGLDVMVLVGSHFLTRRRLRGLATTGAILAFVLAGKSVVQGLWLMVIFQVQRHTDDLCVSLLLMGLMGLTTGTAINGILGGMQTLSILRNREVRRSFR